MSGDGAPGTGWTVGPEGLRRGRLLISFQRFARPAEALPPAAPPSLGALPVGTARGGELVLPVGEGEAFWIGVMSPVAGELDEVHLEAEGAARPRALRFERHSPDLAVVVGIPRADGLVDPLDRRSVLAVKVVVREEPGAAAVASVRVVAPESFAALTGQPPPPPLDAAAGYGGWRLP